MAWFKRSKSESGEGVDAGSTAEAPFTVDADKARQWFQQARAVADARNYEYAITCYLNGIKWDPTNMEAHENLLKVAGVYRSSGGKPASGKEVREMVGDRKRPVDKFAGAELAWVKDATKPDHALKAMQSANRLALSEVAYWIGEWGVRAAAQAKKPSKAMLVNFMDEFEACGGFDKAVECGQAATKVDPSDSNLAARVRNLSAQAAMARGRYDEGTAEEGGFRRSIKDAEAQQALVDDDSIAVGAEAASRRLDRARAEYEEQPDAVDRISKFGDLLRKTGEEPYEREAIKVYYNGWKATGEYRFRTLAADVQLTLDRRKVRAARELAERTGDPEHQQQYEEARLVLLGKEAKEYKDRAEHYPTDLSLRYEHGWRLYQLGEADEAIPELQAASQDARYRARAANAIGHCFMAKGWFEEAIQSFRESVDAYEFKDDETHLGMRYDLMDALARHASESRDLEAAEEANRIASNIALKQLNFRDIGRRRDELKGLVKELKSEA